MHSPATSALILQQESKHKVNALKEVNVNSWFEVQGKTQLDRPYQGCHVPSQPSAEEGRGQGIRQEGGL